MSAYNYWVMMDTVDVAVRHGDNRHSYTGFIVPHGDKNALAKAKEWARTREWNSETREYGEYKEPSVHTFENKGFKATILDSAGGSSQGGRLSFWRCKMEKDGVVFYIGVNDAVLADLIRNSTIKNGEIEEEVMFARKGGQPGIIHTGMQAYKDAKADMERKAEMKKAKKTSKWEKGGVYKTITQTAVCLGEVWDTMEEYQAERENSYRYYSRYETKLRPRETPIKVLAWHYVYKSDDNDDFDLTAWLKEQTERTYAYVETGKPPARAKAGQLTVTKTDDKLIDKYLQLASNGRFKRVTE